MKLRTKANGNVFDAADEAGEALIKTGLYEKYDGKKTEISPTAVGPLTTNDVPPVPATGQRKRSKTR